MAIDIHTHVFNVRYLPMEGIIKARAPWWSRWLVMALVKYLIRRSEDDPVIDGGLESALRAEGLPPASKLDQLLTATPPLSEEDAELLLEELINEATDDEDLFYEEEILRAAAEALKEGLQGEAAADPVRALFPAEMEALVKLEAVGSPESDSVEPFAAALSARRDERSFDREQRRGVFGWLFRKFAELGGFFNWAVFMTKPESEIMRTLIETYQPTAAAENGVRLYIDHMMDMELHYLGGPPQYATPEIRSNRMRKLLASSDGVVVGFYAWCPLRADCMDLVKTALLEKGFCGIKFYPPNGYRASGNAGLDQIDRDCEVVRHGVTGAQIDARNEELFAFCEANEIPIFAHCQPGEMESVGDYTGRMSHPRFWKPVLDRHEDLILCFGHAGGASHWVADFEGNDPWDFKEKKETETKEPCCDEVTDLVLDAPCYAEAVYEICTSKYPNVFSGTGAHEEIFDGNGLFHFQRRLELLFDQSSQNRERDFGDRLIYGSDWHMIYKHADHPFYLKEYETIFRDPSPLKDYRERFFEGNALAFLRLDKYLERSRDHLTSVQVEAVESWLA